jgi:hypothetical protein
VRKPKAPIRYKHKKSVTWWQIKRKKRSQ